MKTTRIAPAQRKAVIRTLAKMGQSRIPRSALLELPRKPERSGLRTNRNGNGNGSGRPKLKIVILGLSITSSWGNGHATTYRTLVRELAARGHDLLFLERNAECYESNRDMPSPPWGRVALYETLSELRDRHTRAVRDADAVIVGSYVPEGIAVGDWALRTASGLVAFYDIDTPVTIAALEERDTSYIARQQIPKYDLYLSFSGGPILKKLEDHFGSPMARPLYCSVDTTLYYPEDCPAKYDLGYMGTYSEDRQPALDELLLEPARNWDEGCFIVAGPNYPRNLRWPKNVRRKTHLPSAKHRLFYCSQKFTLNVPRGDMVEAGFSPSVRLFEAAACGTPIISDFWPGIEAFFKPNEEILISNSSEETLYYILETTDAEREMLSKRARDRVLSEHTSRHRAAELETYICDVLKPSFSE